MSQSNDAPWYRDGLSFTCTRCGSCCTGAPGFVWVDVDEIDAVAGLLGMSRDAFTMKYVRRIGDRYSFKEKRGGDCIFWDKSQGCTVYSARPIQCRTWPFWPENIATQEDWDHIVSICPGAGTGRFFSVEEIEAQARACHPDD